MFENHCSKPNLCTWRLGKKRISGSDVRVLTPLGVVIFKSFSASILGFRENYFQGHKFNESGDIVMRQWCLNFIYTGSTFNLI